jgi:shikimate dehydrogenase
MIMKKYAVLGRSLGHSLSPVMHNMAFKEHNIDAEYSAIEFEPDEISGIIDLLRSEKFAGFNITIPYKSDIVKYIDHLDEAAQKIGAVNTVRMIDDKWIGFNTDVHGFLQPLLKINRQFKKCIVLGNGGAARAVVFALLNHIRPDCIDICARNEEKTFDIIEKLGAPNIAHHDMEHIQQMLSDADLIINTTPLGMSPDTETTPVYPWAKLKQNTVVYDLVYNPLKTRFLREAQEQNPGITIIKGLDMLIHQAAEAFRIWTGKEFPSGKVLSHLQEQLQGS